MLRTDINRYIRAIKDTLRRFYSVNKRGKEITVYCGQLNILRPYAPIPAVRSKPAVYLMLGLPKMSKCLSFGMQ